MVIIHTSKDVHAAPDRVWDVVSDIDSEPEFWHDTKSIKNIKQTGNIVEREVVAFRNSKCREAVKLDNKKPISIEILEGLMRGKKTIVLKTIKNHTTTIDAVWDIKINGLYGIFSGLIKKAYLKTCNTKNT